MDPLSYFDREDEVEKEEYARLKEEFLSAADDHHISVLPKITFAMVKPDAFVRGLTIEVIEGLKRNGLIPIALKVTDMDEALIDELYIFVKQKYYESWWIMPKVFSQAPVIPMILYGEPGEFPHLSGKLRDVIGPTSPDVGRPGNIRYDLKGTNRVLNIIHASDDPAAAIREAKVFFSLDEILDLIANPVEVKYDPDELMPEEVVDISRWSVFNKVKSEASEYLEYGRDDISQLLDIEASVVEKNLPIDDEREALLETEVKMAKICRDILERISDDFVNSARAPADPKGKGKLAERYEDTAIAAELIGVLSDEEWMSGHQGFDRLLMLSMAREFVGSEWEEVVIHSTWAVMPQMVRDLKKYGKKVITSSEVQ